MGKGEDGLGTLLSRTTLAHAVSGAVGSVVAMVLTYPLDRVRTMSQLQTGKEARSIGQMLGNIVSEEGWPGLYKGLQPMLIALGASNFVYFYWFTALKAGLQYMLRHIRGSKALGSAPDGGAFGNLLLASLAGTINVLITTPLWVAYTRLAVQSMNLLRQSKAGIAPSRSAEPVYSGIVDAMRQIADKDGISSLWNGTGASLILVSNPSVQFASYEWLKNKALKFKLKQEPTVKDLAHFGDILDDDSSSLLEVCSESVTGSSDLSSYEYLVLGALAKMVATVVTYPLQVAQTQLRAQAHMSSKDGASAQPRYSSTMDCLRGIYARDGIQGLYKGMEAKLWQTCLTSAFMFAAYEQICAVILRAILWNKYQRKVQ